MLLHSHKAHINRALDKKDPTKLWLLRYGRESAIQVRPDIWPRRLAARTRDFHSRNRSSILREVTSVRELWTERYALTQARPHRPKPGALFEVRGS